MIRSSTLHDVSARNRRAISLGGTAIILVVGASRGAPALAEWSHGAVQSAREVVDEAERARQAVAGRRALEDTMNVRSARYLALAPVLLDGASAATAGATLASLVSGAAAASNARLGSVQVNGGASRDSASDKSRTFARVSVRATLTADVRGLSGFLLALERGPTLLAIEELSVTQAEPAADRSRPEQLQVDLVVAGLALVRPQVDQ